jgi:hypothetical protein
MCLITLIAHYSSSLSNGYVALRQNETQTAAAPVVIGARLLCYSSKCATIGSIT